MWRVVCCDKFSCTSRASGLTISCYGRVLFPTEHRPHKRCIFICCWKSGNLLNFEYTIPKLAAQRQCSPSDGRNRFERSKRVETPPGIPHKIRSKGQISPTPFGNIFTAHNPPPTPQEIHTTEGLQAHGIVSGSGRTSGWVGTCGCFILI